MDLDVWKMAHGLVLDTYRLTRSIPREELFGLISQLRRAIVSVPANIAEGFVKCSKSDKARFFNIAQGFLEECRYYFILASDLGYADTANRFQTLSRVSRMLESDTNAVLSSRFNVRSS
jgi:four helix bundle protein